MSKGSKISIEAVIKAVQEFGGIVDSHSKDESVIKSGAIALLTDLRSGNQMPVLILENQIHSVNKVEMAGDNIRPIVTRNAAAVMHETVGFDEYEELFNLTYEDAFFPKKIGNIVPFNFS